MSTTVSISGTAYDVYVSVAQVDAYANGSLTADAWQALGEDDKARVLVTVTRWIDSQCWKGEKIDSTQPLAFPRTIGDLGTVEQAAIILSVVLAANPELADQSMGLIAASNDGGIQTLKAGSVQITYFRKLNFTVYGSGAISPFPTGVMGLIGAWLCDNGTASWGSAGSKAFGTCEPSRVGTRDRFGFWRPI